MSKQLVPILYIFISSCFIKFFLMKNNRFLILCIVSLLALCAPLQAQYITTVAGTGSMGYGGDGGPAILATLYLPNEVALDSMGNVYFADGTARVRKINPSGIITTIAGCGIDTSFSGDGGPVTLAQLQPTGIAIDRMGNLYIGDAYAYRIRKVDAAGIITTIAGTGVAGYTGDGGPATNAEFGTMGYMTLDKIGNIYISDNHNNCIRRISTSGIITTAAGTGPIGFSGDGGPATAAKFNGTFDVAVDTAGNIYIRCIELPHPEGGHSRYHLYLRRYRGNGLQRRWRASHSRPGKPGCWRICGQFRECVYM
jgi:hypothetical protein